MTEILNQSTGGAVRRKPPWIRVKAPTSAGYHETRRLMRVLHEDLVQRIALLGERSSAGVAPRRRGARGKKNHGRKR